jgi:thiamine biosynthesis protein ThiS
MKSELATVLANGRQEQVQLPCSVAGFVAAHGWKATQVVVERNGVVLGREELETVMINGGDQLEVIVPVAGG